MIDPKTGAVVGIAYAHHQIHEGNSFKINDVQSVSTTTKYWMVTTPNTNTYAHMIFDILCTGEILLLVTEGADRIGTTVLPPINRSRLESTPAATVIVHRDYTGGTTDGTITIKNIRFGATDKFSGDIAEVRGQNEFILKPNTKYVIAVTTYAAVFASLHLSWYEHIPNEWSDRVKE